MLVDVMFRPDPKFAALILLITGIVDSAEPLGSRLPLHPAKSRIAMDERIKKVLILAFIEFSSIYLQPVHQAKIYKWKTSITMR
jgi:hypothetical protein